MSFEGWQRMNYNICTKVSRGQLVCARHKHQMLASLLSWTNGFVVRVAGINGPRSHSGPSFARVRNCPKSLPATFSTAKFPIHSALTLGGLLQR